MFTFRSMIVSETALALMTMPLMLPALRTPPAPESQSMVMLLVMVSAPNPAGSRQSISPPAAVFEMTPANVLQGAVRLHGLASSPTPETHVRVACALANEAKNSIKDSTPKIFKHFM